MTDDAGELAAAAAKLEASVPADDVIVRAEVRSAGYLVRDIVDVPDTWRFLAPNGLAGARPTLVGLLAVRAGVITYAEWNGTVYPMWPAWTANQRAEAMRDLLDQIREDRR